MTNQLHLVQGLVNGHRLGDVQLAADDDWGVADLDLDGFARAEISGNGVGRAIVRRFRLRLLDDDRLDRAQIDRDRIGVATTMVLAAVAGTAQTKRQLVESQIESTELVGAGGFGTHHGTTCDDGDLNALGGVGLTRIALVGQHNLDTLRIRGDSGHTIHLAFDNVTEPLLDLRMTSGNDDFHVDLPRLKRC